jgi:hypothetical protein
MFAWHGVIFSSPTPARLGLADLRASARTHCRFAATSFSTVALDAENRFPPRRSVTMKRLLIGALVAILPLATQAQTKGNGLPMGQKLLYNLEVIAYDADHCPAGNPSGHRIAVKADINDLDQVKGATRPH